MGRKALRAHRREIEDRIAKLRTKVKDKRDRQDDANTDARADDLADEIEALVAELDRLVPRYKKLGRRLVRLAKKARRRKYYASKNFTYAEFGCRDGTPVPESSKAALRHLCENYLEPLRAKYGAVHINSGYRTRSYNASIGGASNSVHIYDEKPGAVAADHTCAASPSTVYAYENTLGPGGLGRYATFTHIDNRQLIGWAIARWTG